MTGQPNDTTPHDIEEDHVVIRQAVVALRESTDLKEIAEVLASLQAMLPEHFASEEAPDGLGANITNQKPEFAFELGQLFQEHRTILETVARLANQAAAVLAGTSRLATTLEAHESRESQLFLDALYTDLGVGD